MRQEVAQPTRRASRRAAAAAGECGTGLPAPLDEDRAAELALAFAALSDPVRLRLLSILAEADGGRVCVCDLVAPLGRSQPTISHHLKILADAEWIDGERRGRWVWYGIVPDRLEAVRATIGTS